MGYSQADVRTHDINLVADLYAHDPNVVYPTYVVYDGTSNGLQTDETKQDVDTIGTVSAEDYINMYWTGWWPTLHIEILDPTMVASATQSSVASLSTTAATSTTSVLMHVSIDIIGTLDVVQVSWLEWFLTLLGINYDDVQFWGTFLDAVIDLALLKLVELGIDGMMASFMIYDAVKSPAAALAGALLLIGVCVGTWLVAANIATLLENEGWAAWIYIYVAYLAISRLVKSPDDKFKAEYRPTARYIGNKLSKWVKNNGKSFEFGLTSKVSLLLVIGFCITNAAYLFLTHMG